MHGDERRCRTFGSVILLACSVGFLLPPSSAAAGSHPASTEAATRQDVRPGPTDAAEIEAFLDGLMAAHLADHGIAGAAVVVVRDGALLFAKGYGWADVERRVPVDPATTLFRIGSVTKLFTWTALMQLRDAGKLDLDTDVGEYLDFRIPATYPEPITVRHLLTHTAGFEDRSFGLFAPPGAATRGEWLRRNVPARVRPPGEDAAYSNYGAALGGYIVERLSGMTWEEYVETQILTPLGMRFATPRQPLRPDLAESLSRGYVHREGRFVEQPFDWVAGPLAPAGGASASVEAMVPFMVAHLQQGRYAGTRILADTTAREMHARAFAPDPRINGFALGFYEKSSHGLRIIGHDGGTQRFFTDLALIPSERLGVLVAYNSVGGSRLASRRFLRTFLDHYYEPVAPGLENVVADGWAGRASRYAGSYLTLRRAYTTWEKPIHATTRVRVAIGGAGEIVLHSQRGVESFFEVEPGRFHAVDGTMEVVFRERPGGSPHMYMSTMVAIPLEKLPPWRDVGLHVAVLVTSLLLLASPLALAPLRIVLRRTRGAGEPLRGFQRALRRAALGFGSLSLAFVGAALAAVGSPDRFLAGEGEAALRAALLIPVLLVPLAVVLVAGAMAAARRSFWNRAARIHFALLAAAAVCFLVQLHYWNLLGWRF
jgi:CubicO group peptidase (beta-lactamase class C family)